MTKKNLGVLFDLDGTLADTAADLLKTLELTLQHLGYDTSQLADLTEYASDGSLGLLEAALGPLPETKQQAYKQVFFEQFYGINGQAFRLFPGVEELLKHLHDHEIPWGVVTNKPACFARPLLKQFPYQPQTFISGDSCTTRKPDIAPMLLASQQINVDPENIYYLGDALRDIDAARGANMKSVAVYWGYIKATDDPQKWNAEYYINNPTELLSLLTNCKIKKTANRTS
ncbi:HAD family hydrolase [Paraferrimonas sp. SM1919]|uniref:HAD family hydrolase n=1 Tax=Paraferrimonas sp. SM1919 TaxID=2662263 RepID=UPI0013D6C03C|nr:HAD-IA family hydrolase [Paraferrimonas sp. SM1919]